MKTQKRRRKRKKRNYTLYYIMLAVFLVIAGATLSLTVFFNIETIQMTGSSLYTLSDLDGVLSVQTGDNLLRLNTKSLAKKVLDHLKKADKVWVKRAFPNTLVIEVEDGEAFTQLLCEDRYYILSKRGRVLEIKEECTPNVPIVIGPKPQNPQIGAYISLMLEHEEKDWLRILFKELQQSGLNDISAVDISNTISLKLYYQNRIEIKLGSFSELDTKLAMLKAVFDSGNIGIEECGVIDITNPDRMYVDSDAELDFSPVSSQGWNWIDPSPAVAGDGDAPDGLGDGEPVGDEPAGSDDGKAPSDASTSSDSGEPPDGSAASSDNGEPSGDSSAHSDGNEPSDDLPAGPAGQPPKGSSSDPSSQTDSSKEPAV